MNIDQLTGLLDKDWRHNLSRRLNVPVETAPPTTEGSPVPAGEDGWTWLCFGAEPRSVYVGASNESWRMLAGWIGGDAEGSIISRGCEAAFAGAWSDLALRLGLPTVRETKSGLTMPQEFDASTLRRQACFLAIPGAERLLLTTAFDDVLLREVRKVYEFGDLAPELAGLRFSLHVTVARCEMELKDVLRLAEGSMIELGKRAGDPIDVRVNGRLLGKGRVAACGDRYGVSLIGTFEESPGELPHE